MNVMNVSRTILASLLLLALPVNAQDVVLDNPQMQAAREAIAATQEAFIDNDLGLTAAEEATFWPLFEEYRADTLPLRDRYVLLLAEFLKRYDAGTVTEEYGERMLRDFFEIRIGLFQVRESYIDRFAEILPMLKVVRFFQLENKLSADVEAELTLIVPLVRTE